MYEFIKTNREKKINFNFSKHCTEVLEVSNSKLILDERSKSRIEVKKRPPSRLYGFPKVHKDNIPIRPIVTFCAFPTYNLCLDTWFKKSTNFGILC